MSRWILFGLIFIAVMGAFFTGGSGSWKGEDLGAALANSQSDQKPVLAVVGAKWCEFCTKLQKETLSDSGVKIELSSWRVIKVDVDTAAGKKVAGDYNVSGFPTMLFLDAKGKELNRVVGFVDPDDMRTAIADAKR